jgi:glycosyltransferase 2 family protein
MQTEQRPKRFALVKTVVKWALCLVVLYYVGRAIYRQFQESEIDLRHLRPDAIMLALSAACFALMGTARAASIRSLTAAYGHGLSWRMANAINWIPQLGKYLPGKVASVVGAVWFLKQGNVPTAVGLSIIATQAGLAVIIGFILSAQLLFDAEVRQSYPNAWIVSVAALLAGLALLHPKVFTRVFNAVLRLARRPPMEVVPRLRDFLRPVVYTTLMWLCAGLALYFTTRAFIHVPLQTVPVFVSAAAVGITVGFLALFSPSGLGVREWVFLKVLPTVVAGGPLIGAAVVANRILQTIVELIMAGAMTLAMRGQNVVIVEPEAARTPPALSDPPQVL